MAHPLSVRRVLNRDWPSFGLSVFIGLWWSLTIGLYLLAAVRPPQGEDGMAFPHFMGAGALIVTLACGGVVVWRVRLIRRVFARGEVIRGRVAFVGENCEDIGYALIAYRYRGHEYRVTNVTEGAPGRGGLTLGDAVEVVVDPTKPSRAFIAKPYLD